MLNTCCLCNKKKQKSITKNNTYKNTFTILTRLLACKGCLKYLFSFTPIIDKSSKTEVESMMYLLCFCDGDASWMLSSWLQQGFK